LSDKKRGNQGWEATTTSSFLERETEQLLNRDPHRVDGKDTYQGIREEGQRTVRQEGSRGGDQRSQGELNFFVMTAVSKKSKKESVYPSRKYGQGVWKEKGEYISGNAICTGIVTTNRRGEAGQKEVIKEKRSQKEIHGETSQPWGLAEVSKEAPLTQLLSPRQERKGERGSNFIFRMVHGEGSRKNHTLKDTEEWGKKGGRKGVDKQNPQPTNKD